MGGGPSPFEAIFGMRRKPSADPLALLDEYEKAHAKGLLAVGVPPLRASVQRRVDAEQREKEAEARAARLIGAPAPDFKLEGLDGRPVSLSDLRGKVVLLAFWGYG